MREILFRGKRKDNGEWVEGYLCKKYYQELPHDRPVIQYKTTGNEHKWTPDYMVAEIDPSTVGQYTGLTDKNDKKIFEGDIFKFPDEVFESYYTSCGTEYNSWEVENYGVVGFCEHSGRFDFIEYKFNENSVEADLHENNNLDFAEFVSELEVIGNIHDNPELLKEGNK